MNEWFSVERPARYTGKEWNSVRKHGAVTSRMAFAFPNTYEIGMSHLGMRLLYDLINREDDLALERVFAPWPDRETQLRKENKRLTTLETGRPLSELDLIGFSLQTEMDFTNILTMLDLSSIPFRAAERDESYPLVIAGGPVAFNPEPIAPFVDLVLTGDAEVSLPALMRMHAELKKSEKDKAEVLRQLETLAGVYAPALHETEIDNDSLLEVLTESSADAPLIPKALAQNLDDHPFPNKMLVPYCDIVHDRVAVEISRGCSRGCRFCQAGVIYMPERHRSAGSVLQSVAGMINSTGYKDVSISALTPNDHPELEGMLSAMMEQFQQESISVSLASLSPSNVDEEMLDKIGGVRKTSLTIAPEAGTQRLRDVINKGITEEQILRTAETAFKLGWRAVKLYFMIGLPTETDEDIRGIAELARKVASLKKGSSVKIGCSYFVPKSHTPFQWVEMCTEEELLRKRSLLREAIGDDRRIKFTSHNLKESLLEAAFSRGDRRLAEVIELAWEKGCRFDGWAEHHKPEAWREAFEETGLDPGLFAHRRLPPFSRLPWSHLGSGVEAGFIRDEYQKALAGVETIRCAPENCAKCRACPPVLLKDKWRDKEKQQVSTFVMPQVTRDRTGEVRKIRLRYSKGPELNFLGHLDLARLVARTFRRAGIAVKTSEGFNPQPRIAFASALPLGQEGRNEYCEALLYFEDNLSELLRRMNAKAPEGLKFTAAVDVESGSKSLSAELAAAEYVIRSNRKAAFDKESLEQFMDHKTLQWVRLHKGKEKRFDIREQVLSLKNDNAWGELRLMLRLGEGIKARPLEVMQAAFKINAEDVVIIRENVYVDRNGKLLPPL